MTNKNYWNLDRSLIRIKDILIVGCSLWAIFVVCARFYPLPSEVEALASQTSDHEKRIAKVEEVVVDIREIKAILLKKSFQQK